MSPNLGGRRAPNNWLTRLRFVAPSAFYWAEDPPEGAEVGDRADFELGGRRWIRSRAGRNINIDQVGKLFRGYQTPSDHRPQRARKTPSKINGKWGAGLRKLADDNGISMSTMYSRLRSGMSTEEAATFSQKETIEWRRNRGFYSEREEAPMETYKKALVWVGTSNFDRYQPPNTLSTFTRLLMRGYTPKQAVLQRETHKDKAQRKAVQPDILTRINALRRDMPEIQRRLSEGPASPGVQVAAQVLGMLNMMLASEGVDDFNSEAVYGNALLTVLAAKKR